MLSAATALHGQGPAAPGIPVLVYHRFDPATPAATTVTTVAFESQLDVLTQEGYKLIFVNEVADIVLGKQSPPTGRVAAITIDDGHRSVFTVAFPIILRRHIPVTLFIYPSAISRSKSNMTWEQLRQMRASGLVEIESHTYWHPDFRKERAHRTDTEYAAFVDFQLIRSREILDKELGTQVSLLAWPYGIVDDTLSSLAKKDGYRAAFGFAGGLARVGDAPFSIHRIPVSNSARGSAFAALLRDAPTHSRESSSHEFDN
jgi:peptidoglycan/xylan/chitin deacetylase (PgdA/CDA1 family)